MEKYNIYFNKFRVAIGIFVAVLVVAIFLITKLVPMFQQISSIQENYKQASSDLVDAERRLEGLKAAKEKKEAQEDDLLKAFFKPISGGIDTESVISDEFGEILQIMRENKIKARAFKYEYDPNDDNFVKNVGNKFHVCRVSADIIANYTQFENFLRDLFKHEHFLEISTIEVAPYQKNKRILLINLKIKLYAQRDPSTVVETPPQQEAPSEQNPENASNPNDAQPQDIPKEGT